MLERDVEVSLSIDPINRSGDTTSFTVGQDDVPRIRFFAPSPAATSSQIWFNSKLGLGTTMMVSGAGALSFTPQAADSLPRGREDPPISTRFISPSARSAALSSLVLRGPGNLFAEFSVVGPSMTLADGVKGWKFSVLPDGTGFSPASAVSAAMMTQLLGDATWVGADGRTVLGSERQGSLPGSLRVATTLGKLEVNWVGGVTRIIMRNSAGNYYAVSSNTSGVLGVAAVP